MNIIGTIDELGWVAVAGFVVAATMIVQQLLIMYRYNDRYDDNWPDAAKFYRRQIKWSIRLCVVSWFVLAALLIYEGTLRDEYPVIDGYRKFLVNAQAPAILLLTAFFTGCIRLFVEHLANEAFRIRRERVSSRSFPIRCLSRIVDVQLLYEMFFSFVDSRHLRSSDDEINLTDSDSKRRHDAWLWWFMLTTLIAFFVAIFWGGKSVTTLSEEFVAIRIGWLVIITIVINSIALLGFLSWLYVGVFTKLTEIHSLSSKMARLFIGDYTDKVTPRQVILIGPKQAGKTAFATVNVKPPKEESDGGTRRLRLRMYTATDQQRHVEIARVAAIDTPGENIGDHIMLATRFRADTLVLVLDAGKLERQQALEEANYAEFEFAYKIFGAQGGSSEGQYLRALWYATNRDPESLNAREIFKVRSFVLYLNHRNKPKEKRIVDEIRDSDHFQRLAEMIGDRFGVLPDDCCAIGGQAPLAAQGRDILGYQDRNQRLSLAEWGWLQVAAEVDGEVEDEIGQREVDEPTDTSQNDEEP